MPSEISDADRVQITRDFARALVDRYGIAVEVAIHAPHCEGDQRNHHAHILTTTRRLEPERFTCLVHVELFSVGSLKSVYRDITPDDHGGDKPKDCQRPDANRQWAIDQGPPITVRYRQFTTQIGFH